MVHNLQDGVALPVKMIPAHYHLFVEDIDKIQDEGWEWNEPEQMFRRVVGGVHQGATAWRVFIDGGLPGPSLVELRALQCAQESQNSVEENPAPLRRHQHGQERGLIRPAGG